MSRALIAVCVAAAALASAAGPAAAQEQDGLASGGPARLRLAAATLPPIKPDEFRESVPESPPAPAFPFNPFASFAPRIEPSADAVPTAALPALAMLPPAKPESFRAAVEDAPSPAPSLFAAVPPSPASPPEPSTSWFGTLFGQAPAQERGTLLPKLSSRGEIDEMIARHAKLNGVPEALVHRIVIRESKYNPRAVGRGGAMGLMQIKTGTARALGYEGGPAGLLDAETNLRYAVKYLAGAYRAADGDHDRAVSHYARGYYYAAKRRGTIETASRRGSAGRGVQEADAGPTETSSTAPRSLFGAVASAAGTRPDR